MGFDTNGNGMAGGDGSGTAISGGTGGCSNSYNTVFAGNGHIISHYTSTSVAVMGTSACSAIPAATPCSGMWASRTPR